MKKLTLSEQDSLNKLALRLGQKISPIDDKLEEKVIDIVDVLREAFDLGFESGEEYGYFNGWDTAIFVGRERE